MESRGVDAGEERIDRDTVWRAKCAALELLWQAQGAPRPVMSDGLRDFATFCALAERHGSALVTLA